MDKKAKAEAKRERRLQRKKLAAEPEADAQQAASEDMPPDSTKPTEDE